MNEEAVLVRVVLVGPPGAGKGTQAEFIAERYEIPKISTGDIFRANVSGGTELGVLAKKFMDAGDLVPDEVTNAMVRDRLEWPDAAVGFLLDGFPRNVAQAYELDGILNAGDLGPRLTSCSNSRSATTRWCAGCPAAELCKKCGHVWHIEFDPPKVDGHLRRCGGQLYLRDDDLPGDGAAPAGGLRRADRAADRVLHRPQAASANRCYGPVEDVTERAIAALDPVRRRLERRACPGHEPPSTDRAEVRRRSSRSCGRPGLVVARALPRCGTRWRPACRRWTSTRSPATSSATAGATSYFLDYDIGNGPYPGGDLRLGERPDRARHPVVGRDAARRRSDLASTSARSSTAGTATPRSPSRSARSRRGSRRCPTRCETCAVGRPGGGPRRRSPQRHLARRRDVGARRSGRYGIVTGYGGHGIGSRMHMDPHILNYGRPGQGPAARRRAWRSRSSR